MAAHDMALMTTATTGAGTLTLGANVSGFLSFANAGVVDQEPLTYCIRDGANSEWGRGTYTASGTTLTRSPLGSTSGGSAINLSGNAQVGLVDLAEDLFPCVLVSSSQTISIPGTYLVDTSGGAITLTVSSTLFGAYTFIDAAATWATNNLTVNGNGHNIGNKATNVAATFVADVSDCQFSMRAAGTYWRLF